MLIEQRSRLTYNYFDSIPVTTIQSKLYAVLLIPLRIFTTILN